MKIKFGLSGRDEKNKEGTNHDVEVYLWDSINEFKEKVVKACQQEAQYLKSVGQTCDVPSSRIGAQSCDLSCWLV